MRSPWIRWPMTSNGLHVSPPSLLRPSHRAGRAASCRAFSGSARGGRWHRPSSTNVEFGLGAACWPQWRRQPSRSEVLGEWARQSSEGLPCTVDLVTAFELRQRLQFTVHHYPWRAVWTFRLASTLALWIGHYLRLAPAIPSQAQPKLRNVKNTRSQHSRPKRSATRQLSVHPGRPWSSSISPT